MKNYLHLNESERYFVELITAIENILNIILLKMENLILLNYYGAMQVSFI